MIITDWENCYPSNWKGLITEESFAHPAKFSNKLIRRIYAHLVDEMKWLAPGDSVIDPFGGVGLGALDALRYGLNWTGNELEPRFVELGNQNIVLWNSRYAGKLPRWGTARIMQGDSRYLVNIIAQINGAVSSPPYANAKAHPAIGNAANDDWGKEGKDIVSRRGLSAKYGITPGQLAALQPGDFQAALSSPPFIQTTGGTNVTSTTGPLSDPALIKRHAAGNQAMNAYGVTPGQLSELREGDYQGVVSSPPYESCRVVDSKAQNGDISTIQEHIDTYGIGSVRRTNKSIETFWTAARAIIEQTYQVLSPGAHAIWVVKAYVKNHTLVDFPHQWQAICESVGFVTLHEHHALFSRHRGTSQTLEGNIIENIVSSKSFFRYLAEAKGAPPIDYETVLCMEKPL